MKAECDEKIETKCDFFTDIQNLKNTEQLTHIRENVSYLKEILSAFLISLNGKAKGKYV